MPNYVVNNIYLKGSQEDIDKLIALLGDNSDSPEEQIDFNNVVKMPESMNLISGTVAHKYVSAYLKTLSGKEKLAVSEKLFRTPDSYYGNYLNKYRESFSEVLTEEDKKYLISRLKEDFKVINPSSIEEVGKAYVDNIINYGADTWYDWSVNNWGTKWNAFESKIENNTISFQTAWSASLPITQKLSKTFPKLLIFHEFADGDMGRNCGRIEFKRGKVSGEYLPKGEEALRFACKVWGYDVRDYGLLPDGVEAMTLEDVIEPYNLGLRVEGETIILEDYGKPGSKYDGLTFEISGIEMSEIITAIDSLLGEAYQQFRQDIEKRGISTDGIFLEDLIDIAPTDINNYGLFYNIVYCNEIMTIKALEEKSLDKVISDATKESESTEAKATEKDDIKEL